MNHEPLPKYRPTTVATICLALAALGVWLAFISESPADCGYWEDPFRRPQPTLADKALLLRAENPATAFPEKLALIKSVDGDEVTLLVRAKLIPMEHWSGALPAGGKTLRDKAGKPFVVEPRGKPGGGYVCQRHPRPALEQALRDAGPDGAPAFAVQPIIAPADIGPLAGHIKWYLLFDTLWFAALLYGAYLVLFRTGLKPWLAYFGGCMALLGLLIAFYLPVASAEDLFHRQPLIRKVAYLSGNLTLGAGIAR